MKKEIDFENISGTNYDDLIDQSIQHWETIFGSKLKKAERRKLISEYNVMATEINRQAGGERVKIIKTKPNNNGILY